MRECMGLGRDVSSAQWLAELDDGDFGHGGNQTNIQA
jgi:hypothetical protein